MTASFLASGRKHLCSITQGLRRASRWGLAAMVLMLGAASALGQTGGDGAITGTVTDTTGAAVPNATVTATNVATSVATSQPTTSGGLYTISPLLPGIYTITVNAKGFESFKQENMTIDALHTSGLNVSL